MMEFNLLRKQYNTLSFQTKQKVYENYYKRFPTQNEFGYDLDYILKQIRTLDNPAVVELGGYEGQLAYEVQKRGIKFKRWISLELIPHKIVENLHNFKEVVLTSELWETSQPFVCDLFVCIHTLEHFSNEECDKLLSYLLKQQIGFLLLTAPLELDGQDWNNYYGAHVLTYGINHIKERLKKGFTLCNERFATNVYGGWCSFWKKLG